MSTFVVSFSVETSLVLVAIETGIPGWKAKHEIRIPVAIDVFHVTVTSGARLALAAYVRRRSHPYLLIVSAVGALFARSVVACLTTIGTLSTETHHFLEHGLDVVLVALVVAAVYYARTTTASLDSDP